MIWTVVVISFVLLVLFDYINFNIPKTAIDIKSSNMSEILFTEGASTFVYFVDITFIDKEKHLICGLQNLYSQKKTPFNALM